MSFILRMMILAALLSFSAGQSGCEQQPASGQKVWDDLFSLVQQGRVVQGTIQQINSESSAAYSYSVQGTAAEVEIRYPDESGATQTITELWPAEETSKVKIGQMVSVYVLSENSTVKAASNHLLRQQKAMN